MADIGRDPSHFLQSWTHIPQPYWDVAVEAGNVPFCCHRGWHAGTSTTVAKLCSGKFFRRPEAFGERHLQEAAAHTERKTQQKGEVVFSTEANQTGSASPTEFFVSEVIWEIDSWSDTPTLQVAETLMKLLPDLIRKCNNCAVTAPDHILPVLCSHAVPLRLRALSSTKPAGRLLSVLADTC